MPDFSDEQKQIALLLMHAPKTVEELNKQLNIPYDKLQALLKEMLKLKLVAKEGFPTKYVLKKEIVEAVKKRKETAETDSNRLRLQIIIEAQAIEQDLMEKKLKEIEEILQKEPDFTIYECILEKTIKEGEHYKSYLEVNLSVKDFKALMRLIFFYGPTAIEVIKPNKLELEASDLQDGLVDAAEMVHNYNQYIMGLLNRQELAEFNRKLFS